MKNLGQMLKQAQEMQAKMLRMQESLGEVEVAGSAGGGLVRATLNGRGEMRGVSIDDSLVKVDEKEILEDLIVAAVNDARAKVDALVKEKSSEIMGGIELPPGMSLPS
jgi:DNA-binding YbaB/EbfC family protein